MATVTARIPVLVTESEKSRIAKKAKDAKLSVGEYMRRAAKSFQPSDDDDEVLEAVIKQMEKATESAEKAIDETLKFVAASNKRIAKMEAKKETS